LGFVCVCVCFLLKTRNDTMHLTRKKNSRNHWMRNDLCSDDSLSTCSESVWTNHLTKKRMRSRNCQKAREWTMSGVMTMEREEVNGWNARYTDSNPAMVPCPRLHFDSLAALRTRRGTYWAHYEMWRVVSGANKFSSLEYIRQHVSCKKPSFAPRQ